MLVIREIVRHNQLRGLKTGADDGSLHRQYLVGRLREEEIRVVAPHPENSVLDRNVPHEGVLEVGKFLTVLMAAKSDISAVIRATKSFRSLVPKLERIFETCDESIDF
jgi:hypothetical protein